MVLVDDSIVRGTTSLKIVQMIREAGAKEVHMRVASPMITHSDYYGIDTPDPDKLLANQYRRPRGHGRVHRGRHAGLPVDRGALRRRRRHGRATRDAAILPIIASPAIIRRR